MKPSDIYKACGEGDLDTLKSFLGNIEVDIESVISGADLLRRATLGTFTYC